MNAVAMIFGCMLLNIVWRVPLDDWQDRKKNERTEKMKVCTAPDVRVSLREYASTIALDTSLSFLGCCRV
jgi:hypothetical protein